MALMKIGSKPDFHGAASPTQAKVIYEHFFAKVREGLPKGAEKVKDGVFRKWRLQGARYHIQLISMGWDNISRRCF